MPLGNGLSCTKVMFWSVLVSEQNSVIVDAKGKKNICREGHLNNNNRPRPTLKNGPESFYKL